MQVTSEPSEHAPSLLQRRWMRAWLVLLALLLVGTPLALALHLEAVALVGVLLGAAIAPIVFLIALDERTGAWHAALAHRAVLVLAATVGGIVSVAASLALAPAGESELGRNAYTLLVGPTEELAKLLVPIAIWVLLPRLDVRTKLVVAVLSAAGFQVLENLLVTLGASIATSPATGLFVLASRALLGLFMHPMWTGSIAGAWLQVPARFASSRARRISWRAGAFGLVAAIHSTWDLSTSASNRVAGSIGVVGMLVATLVAWRYATASLAGYQQPQQCRR